MIEKSKLQYFIWFFSFLIILQVGWLNKRFNKLVANLPENIAARQKKETDQKLQQIPEVQIEENLPQEAKLFSRLKEATSDGQLTIEVWATSSQPVVEAKVGLFYLPKNIKVIDDQWRVDKEAGYALWSGELESPKQGDFLVKTITFNADSPVKMEVNFDFQKESLLDCNLLNKQGNDLLEEVEKSQYQLK